MKDHETASIAYGYNYRLCKRLLEIAGDGLIQHSKGHAQHKTKWVWPGDLGRVVDSLLDVIQSLGVGDRAMILEKALTTMEGSNEHE